MGLGSSRYSRVQADGDVPPQVVQELRSVWGTGARMASAATIQPAAEIAFAIDLITCACPMLDAAMSTLTSFQHPPSLQ
jgi:hypothetical protein